MALTLTGSEFITGLQSGTQTNVKTTQLANGGWVTAWNTPSGSGSNATVNFQIYDGAGNKVGGPVLAPQNVTGTQVLQDVLTTPDGRFTLAWTSGTNVVTRSFDSSGVATSNEVTTATLTGFAAQGVQLVASGSGQYKVFSSSYDFLSAVVRAQGSEHTTSGTQVSAPATIPMGVGIGFGGAVVDSIDGLQPGESYLLFNTGQLVSTTNPTLAGVASAGSDPANIAKVEPGFYVVTSDLDNLSTALISISVPDNLGNGTLASDTAVGAPVTAGMSPNTYAKQLVNLGGGRLLSFAMIDPGTDSSVNDGLYANIYDLSTGRLELTTSILIAQMRDITATVAKLSATVLADGRVVVQWTDSNGLTDFDVHGRIIDPRKGGVSVVGSALADNFVGSGWNDSFSQLTLADKVNGGDGSDIAVFAGGTAYRIDLERPGNLVSIESLSGAALDDEFWGTADANTLIGNNGNDRLVGRAGDDLLDGGAGTDNIDGGLGADLIQGGNDADILHGGSGADVINGGDGNDRAFGGLDNDVIAGGIGNDAISGGEGDDELSGNDGNDVIRTGAGDNIVEGGSGNDLIVVGNGLNIVSGGLDTDTISYAQANLPLGLQGFFVDLDPGADSIAGLLGGSLDDDILNLIENVTGSIGDDVLFGSATSNILRGGQGNDILFGRGGVDSLFGGAGADSFIYDSATAQNDSIRDFTVGSDKILILGAAFNNINAGDIAASFIAGAAPVAAGAAPVFLFDNAGPGAGTLSFDSNGNVAGGVVVLALISFTTANGLTTFGAGDFAFL